jgi:hypothetical protein
MFITVIPGLQIPFKFSPSLQCSASATAPWAPSSPSSRPLLPRPKCPLNDYQSMGVYPHPHGHVDLALVLVPARDAMAEAAP